MDALKNIILAFLTDHLRRLADWKFWAALVLITAAPMILKQLGLTDNQFQIAMTAIGYVTVRLGIAMPIKTGPKPGELESPKI